MNILGGILIPFLGTTLGAALVFFMKKNINKSLEKTLLGFASGVMIAASVWSLLLPSIELASNSGVPPFIPPAIGFLLGVLFLIIIDKLTSNIYAKHPTKNRKKNSFMLFLAVTLHNVPEGMAVGVAFAGFMKGTPGLTFMGALILAVGIGIQNAPEGAIISMPLKSEGYSKKKAFLIGVISGVVEPISALLTILLTNIVVPVLPYLLAFAAGAMIYVVAEELIPEASRGKHTYLGTIGVSLGFVIMMVLDVALG